MKKPYQKPMAEVVRVRCKDRLLDWQDEVWGGGSNDKDHNDAKEMQIRFEEEQDMHQELNKIFNEENLVDPWK